MIQVDRHKPAPYKSGQPRTTITVTEFRYMKGDPYASTAGRSKSVSVYGENLRAVMERVCGALGLRSPFAKPRRRKGRYCRFCLEPLQLFRRNDQGVEYWRHPWGKRKACPFGPYNQQRLARMTDAERFVDCGAADEPKQPRRRLLL